MSTRGTLSGIFASIAILIIGWQAGNAVITSEAASSSPAVGGTSPSGARSAAPGSSAAGPPTSSPRPSSTASPTAIPAPEPTTASSVKDGTFTGRSVSTDYGNVQVRITVASSRITDVTPLQLTNDGGRSVQISNQAVPVLRSEVLQSQSAKVSTVSGATYTSEGYLTSLQSALDQAGF